MGDISTRSSEAAFAARLASSKVTIPNCLPSASISRTVAAKILSFKRVFLLLILPYPLYRFLLKRESRREINVSSAIEPKSSPSRVLTETAPSSISRSPITSI